MQSPFMPTLLLILLYGIGLLVLFVFLQGLQRALKNCSPASRTMQPGKVWLWLIPVFGLVWQFIVVTSIAKSLRNEFARLEIPCSEPAPAQTTGLAFCICNCCFFIRLFSVLFGDLISIVGFVLWIVYWKRVTDYSSRLYAHRATTPVPPIV